MHKKQIPALATEINILPLQVTLQNHSITLMAFIKVWIHLVWSTKNRQPFLASQDIRKQVFRHILEKASEKNIHIDFINGHIDHVHCLLSLQHDQSLSKLLQQIKGESSFWINQQQLIEEKFEWQDEYFAVSVSESQLDRVREYIKNQEEHHRKKTFQQEYEEFINKYQF